MASGPVHIKEEWQWVRSGELEAAGLMAGLRLSIARRAPAVAGSWRPSRGEMPAPLKGWVAGALPFPPFESYRNRNSPQFGVRAVSAFVDSKALPAYPVWVQYDGRYVLY